MSGNDDEVLIALSEARAYLMRKMDGTCDDADLTWCAEHLVDETINALRSSTPPDPEPLIEAMGQIPTIKRPMIVGWACAAIFRESGHVPPLIHAEACSLVVKTYDYIAYFDTATAMEAAKDEAKAWKADAEKSAAVAMEATERASKIWRFLAFLKGTIGKKLDKGQELDDVWRQLQEMVDRPPKPVPGVPVRQKSYRRNDSRPSHAGSVSGLFSSGYHGDGGDHSGSAFDDVFL